MSTLKHQELFSEIENEIVRAEAKHGNQDNTPSLDKQMLLLGYDAQAMAEEYEIPTANRAKFMCNTAMKRKTVTHAHIVTEELCEAVECMKDEQAMRIELVQLAATVVKWIRSIDSRKA